MSCHQIQMFIFANIYTLLSVLVFFYNYAEDFSPGPVELSLWSQLRSCCLFHLLTVAASKPVRAVAVHIQVVLPGSSVSACLDLRGVTEQPLFHTSMPVWLSFYVCSASVREAVLISVRCA